MTGDTKKKLNLLLKAGILLLAAYFIYTKLSDNANLRQFDSLIKELDIRRVYAVLGLVFFLMLINWFLEALKWRFLIRNLQPISIWRAVESVFCGLTLAVFTPNRIGEYGGRIFFLTPRKRIFGAIAMGVGAIGQMAVTNILGSIALFWFLVEYVELSYWIYYALFALVVIYCLFFFLLFFYIKVLLIILTSIPFLKRFQRFFYILASYKIRDLLSVFAYSLLRFIVFTSQYCLVISLLIPSISPVPMVMMIIILFFIQSALPSLDLLDVGVRTMTATYFFSFISSDEVAVMAATASIWLINLIIPAILGSVFVFKLNFFGTKRT